MNKAELILAIAERSELSKKDVEKAFKALTETVTEELVKGGNVQIVGFGKFSITKRAERDGVSPHTGELIRVKASKTPRFKAGKALKEAVNGR
ncbi:MAG: HU family DNA-binding protein [Desulfobacterales bacterium]|nr:HU family DNA-binding protein [Desulfobacterales bacterium]